MKAIIKQGEELISSTHMKDGTLIVNLKEKWPVFDSIEFKKQRLTMEVGWFAPVILAFSGHVNSIEFDHIEKDQLVFKYD